MRYVRTAGGPNVTALVTLWCIHYPLGKAQGLNRPPALDDRANNGTVTNYLLSFIPNMDMSLLSRAQVLNIKQYHMRHGIHSKSSSKGNAIYISLPLCISNDVHPHPGPLGVNLNTRAECVARLFAGLVLGRPLHVMHVI